MTRDELLRRFPKASEAFIRQNICADNPRQIAKPKPTARTQQVHSGEAQTRHTGRFLVSVTSIRKRLLDADNLVPKWHIDCLRYAGIIPDDSPDKCEIKIAQRKCEKGEEEKIEITIDAL